MVSDESVEFESKLRSRLTKFLHFRSPWFDQVQSVLCARPTRCQIVFFGGLLRDLLYYGDDASPRDVDIVTTSLEAAELELAFRPHVRRRNRFGGLNLFVAGTSIDIWPLHETWLFQNKRLTNPLVSDLPRSTFFNIEGVVAEVDMASRSAGSIHFSHGFCESISTRTLEINNEDNPFPHLCVIRAFELASRLCFKWGDRLKEYVKQRLDRTTVEDIIELLTQRTGNQNVSRGLLKRWIQNYSPDLYSNLYRHLAESEIF